MPRHLALLNRPWFEDDPKKDADFKRMLEELFRFVRADITDTVITVDDDSFTIQDDGDDTKQGQFQLSGLTTGNTRTLTWPDGNGTIARLENKLSAFAATTSAELASVLSDETGDGGGFVRANNPALVTPNLGTPSAVTLTNGAGLPTILVANEASDTSCFVTFFTAATGELGPKTNAGLTFNSSTGALAATSFVGPLTGNADTVTWANEASDTSCFIGFATAASGSLAPKTNANMTFNSSTGVATFGQTIVGSINGNAGTATALQTSRTIGGTSFDGTANIVPATITVADTTDSSCNVALFESATGDLAPKTDAGITYNASSGTLTATAFAGPLTGNVTGNVTGNAGTVTVADAGGDTTTFPLLGTDATGSLSPRTDAGLTYNANTNALTTTTFIGALTGNVTGDVTGNAGTVTWANEATDTTCFIAFATAASGSLAPKTNTNMTFNSNTGVVTFASSALTTTDINGGTVDGVTIGGSSAGAITGTTITANTSVSLPAGAVNAPTLFLAGDTTSGYYRPASNQLGVTISGTQRGLWSSSGLAVTGAITMSGTPNLIGTTTSTLFNGVDTAAFQVSSGATTGVFGRYNNGATGGVVYFMKGRNGTGDASVAISANDAMGGLGWAGADTSVFAAGARIQARTPATWTTTSHPAQLVFSLCPTGSTTITDRVLFDDLGNINPNASGSALATTATDGFFYLPTCAGTPTGTPAYLPTGARPCVIDSTNNKLYFYSSGAWRDAGP